MLEELIQSGQKEIQIIVFKLGNEEYAVPINCIHEIIIPQKITRIPKSPFYVNGFINLRGNIIPVIDGKKKFNLKESPENEKKDERIIVMEVEKDTLGLFVDSVNEVITLDVGQIEPPPVDMDEHTDIFWGIGKYNDRLLILIKAERFMEINPEVKDINALSNINEVLKQVKAAV